MSVAGALATTSAGANPVDTFGYGGRSTAMAGANVADVDDFSANYYNPAGLVASKGLRFDVGYVHASHHLQMNGRDNQVDPLRAMEFGIVAPGKIAALPFAIGIGMHLPDDRVLRVRSLEQQQPRWEMFDNRTQRLFFAANVAVRPWPWLEVGGGLSFLAQTHARLDITGDVDLAEPIMSELRHEVDADLTSIRYPQAGVRVIASDRLRFGAVYRGSFQLALDIEARLAVTAQYLQVQVPLLALITTRSINAFLPRQVVAGGSWAATDAVTIDADLTWIQWSAYESPVTRVTSDIKIDAPAGFPSRLLPEKPAPTLVLDPGFRDTIVPRLGVEWRLPLQARGRDGHQLALRGGYLYERSPIPEQTGETNFVDADRHVLTGGVGIKLADALEVIPGDVRLDLYGTFSYLPPRTMHKADAFDRVGDYTAKGTIWLLGATLGVVFR